MATKVTKKVVKKVAKTVQTPETIVVDLPEDSTLRGNYPHAVLHAFKTGGILAATDLAIKLCKDTKKLTKKDAAKYVEACVKTRGQPHLLDLFEGEN